MSISSDFLLSDVLTKSIVSGYSFFPYSPNFCRYIAYKLVNLTRKFVIILSVATLETRFMKNEIYKLFLSQLWFCLLFNALLTCMYSLQLSTKRRSASRRPVTADFYFRWTFTCVRRASREGCVSSTTCSSTRTARSPAFAMRSSSSGTRRNHFAQHSGSRAP